MAALRVNPIEFFTGITSGSSGPSYKPGRDGSDRITLPELLGAGPGGVGGNFAGTAGRYDNLQNAVATNLGGLSGIATTAVKSAALGIGFRLVGRFTRKARSGMNTQILKPLGVADMVRM
jgi:hypothetical protein